MAKVSKLVIPGRERSERTGIHTPQRPGLWVPGPPSAAPRNDRKLIAVAAVDSVEFAQIGRPVGAAAAGVVRFVLLGGLFADLGRDLDQRRAGRLQRQLDFRGLDE